MHLGEKNFQKKPDTCPVFDLSKNFKKYGPMKLQLSNSQPHKSSSI